MNSSHLFSSRQISPVASVLAPPALVHTVVSMMTIATPPPSLTVVIPAFNEALRLPPVLDASLAYLQAGQRPWELIVVDDGSSDGTSEVVRQRCSSCERGRLRLLRADGNGGKGAALRAGAAAARGDRIALVDADGATPLSALPALERALDAAGCGVAVGSRSDVLRRRPPYRRLMSAVFSLLAMSCVADLDDTQCGLEPSLRLRLRLRLRLSLRLPLPLTRCGFKLLTRQAAERTFPHLHVAGWAYDVRAAPHPPPLGDATRAPPKAGLQPRSPLARCVCRWSYSTLRSNSASASPLRRCRGATCPAPRCAPSHRSAWLSMSRAYVCSTLPGCGACHSSKPRGRSKPRRGRGPRDEAPRVAWPVPSMPSSTT